MPPKCAHLMIRGTRSFVGNYVDHAGENVLPRMSNRSYAHKTWIGCEIRAAQFLRPNNPLIERTFYKSHISYDKNMENYGLKIVYTRLLEESLSNESKTEIFQIPNLFRIFIYLIWIWNLNQIKFRFSRALQQLMLTKTNGRHQIYWRYKFFINYYIKNLPLTILTNNYK